MVCLESAAVWSHRASSRSTWVMVELVADGIRGVGELSDGGPVAELVAAARSVGSSIVGLPLEQVRTELRSADTFLWSTVLGGYEAALADLVARLEDRPLAESLGLGEPQPVRLYANLNRRYGGDGADAIVAEAVCAVGNGFSAVKVAPFLDNHARGMSGMQLVDAGLELVTKVRETLPDGVRLMVDCHHLVPTGSVAPVARELAALDLYWVEDLVRVDDPAAMEAAAASGLALAAGEHVWRPAAAAAACAGGALTYWLVDPKHAGGPAGVARIAEAVGDTQLTFHNPSGPIGTAHAAHLAALGGAGTWLEFAWGETDRLAFLDPPEVVVDGRLRPAGPGIGCAPRTPYGVELTRVGEE
ncbi:enolase C-terminal domain-like protein [Kribbella sp. NPDC000426]|uniref:enolase C-terminal domain-like protein n=1 Tax=Kribbella sp. NPDC000426 TaxID=3154255 RepID=UPI0033235E6A